MIIESRTSDEELASRIQEVLKSGPVKTNVDNLFLDAEPNAKLLINIDMLRENHQTLAEDCIRRPIEMTRMFEEGIRILRSNLFNDDFDVANQTWRVSFEGNLGSNTVTPRGLKARLINKLVKIQGIVVSTSKVRHRLLKSTHYCHLTNEFSYYLYQDYLNLRQNRSENSEYRRKVPLYDDKNNPVEMEYGFCEYKDIQIVTIQEMPENIPTGLMSRSIEVIVQEDMVDELKPGDRTQITGIFRPMATSTTPVSGLFRNCVMATSIYLLTSVGDFNLTSKEIKSIKEIGKRPDLLKLMVRSIAPSIFGHEEIKEGLLVQLLGGTEKIFDEAMRLRGDINVLLVGDPSTGKSQFLRRMMTIANLSFSTTGRGSTGVGLTAAITIDKDTGEKHLEAGAMVLADRGVICVDEFDKMDIEDRVAMHEVMEQQTVTIAKAGIHVSLNARCSVLAAANPKYGEYEERRSVETNINMPPSLLSRFDLIFIVRDRKDKDLDRKISERVTKNHRFEGQTSSLLTNNDSSGIVPLEIFERRPDVVEEFEQYNKYLHEHKNVQYLKVNFLKKYIMYAKAQTPELTEICRELLCKKWTRLRHLDSEYAKNFGNRIITQTIRSLESLIRISTAFAKLRLSLAVEFLDVYRAFELFNLAFYGGTEKIDSNFWVDEQNEIDKVKDNILGRPFKRQSDPELARPNPQKITKNNISDSLKLDDECVKDVLRTLINKAKSRRMQSVSAQELFETMRTSPTFVYTQEAFENCVGILINEGKILREGEIFYPL